MYSVLPPPSRFPTQNAYGAALPSSMPAPMIETSNVLSHPVGPEYQLLVGEGMYFPAIPVSSLPFIYDICNRYICPPGRSAPSDTSTSSFRSPYHEYKSVSNYTGSRNRRGQAVVGCPQSTKFSAAVVQTQHFDEHSIELEDV